MDQLHEIFDQFNESRSFLIELQRTLGSENFYLICFLCDQHDVESSIPVLLYLNKVKDSNAPLQLDKETLLSLLDDDMRMQVEIYEL